MHFKPRLIYDSTELTSPYYDATTPENVEYLRKEDLIPPGPVKPSNGN